MFFIHQECSDLTMAFLCWPGFVLSRRERDFIWGSVLPVHVPSVPLSFLHGSMWTEARNSGFIAMRLKWRQGWS